MLITFSTFSLCTSFTLLGGNFFLPLDVNIVLFRCYVLEFIGPSICLSLKKSHICVTQSRNLRASEASSLAEGDLLQGYVTNCKQVMVLAVLTQNVFNRSDITMPRTVHLHIAQVGKNEQLSVNFFVEKKMSFKVSSTPTHCSICRRSSPMHIAVMFCVHEVRCYKNRSHLYNLLTEQVFAKVLRLKFSLNFIAKRLQ